MHTLRLSIQQLVPELLPVAVGGRLFDDNLFPVVGDLVDDVLGALAELEVVEGADAVGRYADTGGGLRALLISGIIKAWVRLEHTILKGCEGVSNGGVVVVERLRNSGCQQQECERQRGALH